MAQDDYLEKYRDSLLEAEHTASRDYDKAILTLSTGALGFITQIVPHPSSFTLFFLGSGWLSLVLSLLSTLVSLLTSQFALRKAVEQVDEKSIQEGTPGGVLTPVTSFLNVSASVFLIIGISFLVVFAFLNIALKVIP